MSTLLPALPDWDKTRVGLQRAAQVVSAVRASVTPPLPNAQRLSLRPARVGLTTGPLTIGGQVLLDYHHLAVVYRQPGEPDVRAPLAGHSQWTLAGTVIGLLSDEGHDLVIDRNKLADESPLAVDMQAAVDYARAQYAIFSAAARFRAQLSGSVSSVVVWPHGFDLSFLWFAGSGSDEHRDPHINFGFSPASAGFDRPYLYVYAYPSPPNLAEIPLPPLAYLHNGSWTGVVVPYDELLSASDPEILIESLYEEIYLAIAPLIR